MTLTKDEAEDFLERFGAVIEWYYLKVNENPDLDITIPLEEPADEFEYQQLVKEKRVNMAKVFQQNTVT